MGSTQLYGLQVTQGVQKVKTITLFKEHDVPVDMEAIVGNLNAICKTDTFKKGKSRFSVKSDVVQYPASYRNLSSTIRREAKNDLFSFLMTNKQYYNNYFFESHGNLAILSFYGWDYLTKLSRNNGLVLFIADFLALEIDGTYRHQDTTGCIYDFLWDKTGIDAGMRSSFICPRCLTRISTKKLSKLQRDLLVDLNQILNVLGAASKWNLDIVEYWNTSDTAQKQEKVKDEQVLPQLDFIPDKDEEGYINVYREAIKELCKNYLELTNEPLPPNKKGKIFEQFARHFFGLIKGWKIIECNANLKDCEIDIIYDISEGPEPLKSKLGDNIYVECKNRIDKSDSRDISQFLVNLKSRGLKAGIFFSYNGITGYSPDNWRNVDAAYKRIIDFCRQERTYALPMVSRDIELIRNGGDLVEHILEMFNRFIRI